MTNNIKVRHLSRKEMHSLKNYLGQGMYQTLYAIVKYIPLPVIGNYLRFVVLKIFMKKLRTTYIDEMVTVYFPWNVEIGKKSSLNQGVMIDGTAPVRIGEGVRIAPNVYINTADHEIKAGEWIARQGFVVGGIVIEDDVWIGAGAILLKGVTIGKGSVIGAGSVVTKDIPPQSVAAGSPCRVIRKRE